MENKMLSEFANDIYDVFGMNTAFITQENFYYKWVDDDKSFMLDEENDSAKIYFDDFTIIIKPNK